VKIRWRFNSWIAKKLKVDAITIYPFVFIAAPRRTAESGLGGFISEKATLCHEFVHVRQIEELGWLKFYFKYLWEFFVNYRESGDWDWAYRNISFEIEAYRIQEKFDREYGVKTAVASEKLNAGEPVTLENGKVFRVHRDN
jgi:hypothetical protein